MSSEEGAANCADFFSKYAKHQEENWKLVKESDGVKVWKQTEKCSLPAYKSEMTVDVAPDRLLEIVSPAGPYRLQWDAFLDKLETVETIAEGVFVIYHIVKPSMKGIISARDSVDLVCIGKKDDISYVVAQAIDHEKCPVQSSYVRVKQHPSGYLIFPVEGNPNQSRFLMVFHSDLNMNMVGNFVIDMAKPTLMIEKNVHLRNGLAKIK